MDAPVAVVRSNLKEESLIKLLSLTGVKVRFSGQLAGPILFPKSSLLIYWLKASTLLLDISRLLEWLETFVTPLQERYHSVLLIHLDSPDLSSLNQLQQSVRDANRYLPILPVLSESDAIYMMLKLHRALSPELQSKLKAILSKESPDTSCETTPSA